MSAAEGLYATPWDALYAGIAAAGAPLHGTARPHTDSLGGRTGCGAWTDRDKADQIADGLRLTGYEVVLLPGYSTGVVILDRTSSSDVGGASDVDHP